MRAVLNRRGTIAGAAARRCLRSARSCSLIVVSGAALRRRRALTVTLPAACHRQIYAAPEARGRPIVVIDAGHGGRDPGASSVSGQVSEKDLTLALARELRDDLVKRGRVRVAMTRDDDRYLTLEDRAAVARRLGAAMFVSLHMDSAPNPLARGASVYSLSDVASDAEAARVAAARKCGAGDVTAAVRSQAMLSDLAMRQQMSASADLAARLVNKSSGRFELRPNPHRFAAFHVLRRVGCARSPVRGRIYQQRRRRGAAPLARPAEQDRTGACTGHRNRRRRAFAALTGFPHQP